MTTAIVTGQGVRLRETPANGTVITSLKKGAQVETFESKDGWTHISLLLNGEEKHGWISAQFLQAAAAAAQPAAPSAPAPAGGGGITNLPAFLGRVAQM